MSRSIKARSLRLAGSRPWRVILLLLLLPLLVACSSGEETPSSAAVQITLLPGQSANELQVQLRDPTQAPITDATVALEGNMNHAGMVPVLADPVRDDADGATDGVYRLPFQFSMLGDWIVTVTATLADGTEATKDVEVIVTDGGVQIHDEAAPAASSGQMAEAMMVHDVMAPASPLAGGNGAVYFMVMNNTAQDDRLVAVESAVAAAAELHESVEENNVIRMEPRPDGFEIPAGGSVTLAPGGKHVMLVNLNAPLVEGESFALTLRFEHAPAISVTVPIVAPGTAPGGEHQHGG
ncbi:MAG: copper chaperone PCu(A)C [Caldilinea sp. CFX5]|nr:copper chaperone PCu(A)C [Caldilinea sp. CFX5]